MAKPFQFRLRTLLLAVVPVAVVAMPLGYYLRPTPTQYIHVTGILRLNGVPLADAPIAFIPVDPDGRPAIGTTDRAGRFRLETFLSGFNNVATGALPGSYKICLARIVNAAATKPIIPERYYDASTSGMPAEVTRDGQNFFTFNLTTP